MNGTDRLIIELGDAISRATNTHLASAAAAGFGIVILIHTCGVERLYIFAVNTKTVTTNCRWNIIITLEDIEPRSLADE